MTTKEARVDLGNYVPVSKAKSQLLRLIREVEQRGEPIALTRDGVPAAVLLGMEQFQGLLETLEILADSKTMRSLRRSLLQAEKRQWVSHDDVFGKDSR
ncbi:MAG TPA: type II toxin-antitoxin system Phd/YefM family antitoxin [Vicinamibacteria bacterium]|nr:type II toxin-antitoxin system Phd/YefM family antitoxin [Vicinamibacteria bacterium]